MRKVSLISIFVGTFLMFSCNGETSNSVVEDLPIKHQNHSLDLQIPFKDDNGTKYVEIKINGTPIEAIFDTGCSVGVSMSLAELQLLIKSGKIAQYDVLGTANSVIADGTVVENLKIRLHQVELDEKLVLEDVIAYVDLNMEAPVLLGTEVLDNISRTYKIDNDKQVIVFTRK